MVCVFLLFYSYICIIFNCVKYYDMISSSKILFGVPIRCDEETSFMSLTDLQEAYLRKRIVEGWSDKRIEGVLSNRNSSERIYYVIKDKYIRGISLSSFINDVNNTSLVKTLKSLGVYKSTGRGSNRLVMCAKEIWMMVAMELHPSIYNECIKMFGSSDISDNAIIYIRGRNEYNDMYRLLSSFFSSDDIDRIILAINKSVTGDCHKYLYTKQESERIVCIQRDICKFMKRGMFESVDDVIDILTNAIDDDPDCFVFTYLAIDELSKDIKIGKTFDVRKRESVLRCANPRLSIIAYVKGDIERCLHERFSDKRSIGEWFSLSDNDIDSVIDEYDFILQKM